MKDMNSKGVKNTMVKVLTVTVDHMRNETCSRTVDYPEGRFPRVEIEVAVPGTITPEVLIGKTCACGEGHKTYGTWRLPPEGMQFESIEALKHYLVKDDAYALSHGLAR
jgi:hypothetical protein